MVIVFGAPTDSTLYVVFLIVDVLSSFDLHGLSKFLIVELFLGHFQLIASEILDSKSDSSEFDSVELLYFIVVFTSFVFK